MSLDSIVRSSLLYGDDPQVLCLCWAALALWYLGYPNQARQSINQALRIAQELAHPFGLAFALFWAAFLHQACGEVQRVREHTDALVTLTSSRSFRYLQLCRAARIVCPL